MINEVEVEVDKSLFSQMLFSDDQSLIPCNENTISTKEKARKENMNEIPLLVKVTWPTCSYLVTFLSELIN